MLQAATMIFLQATNNQMIPCALGDRLMMQLQSINCQYSAVVQIHKYFHTVEVFLKFVWKLLIHLLIKN